MDNVRFNVSPCSQDEAQQFIAKVETDGYDLRGIVTATERSHYDRYAFFRGDARVAVVYDTMARALSITSSEKYAQELLDLFGADGKTVKRSTVPAPGGQSKPEERADDEKSDSRAATRSKLFVPAEALNRRPSVETSTVIATAKGVELSTDEIYPPQRAKRLADHMTEREQQYNNRVREHREVTTEPTAYTARSEQVGMTISASTAQSGRPRKATVSFGGEDYGTSRTPSTARPIGGTGVFADVSAGKTQQQPPQQQQPQNNNNTDSGNGADGRTAAQPEQPQKRKRGRPPKNNKPPLPLDENGNPIKRKRGRPPKEPTPEQLQKNQPTEYIARNFSKQDMSALFTWLKRTNRNIVPDLTEVDKTQQVISYMVSNASGDKVRLRFAPVQSAVQITGLKASLFDSLKSKIESFGAQAVQRNNPAQQPQYAVVKPQPTQTQQRYVAPQQSQQPQQKQQQQRPQQSAAINEKFKPLAQRIPTAFEYLSEQSKADFACGLHDFSQKNLVISDYSVLLVPPFRALERFVFDLQRSEGITVKMIGQAYDKDENGKYILKRGYQQRINSVVYAEVMVALYIEYFSQRNFFAHTDNTGENVSRTIPDRLAAKEIFEHLLDVVEYNAAKLKEVGYKLNR